MTPEGVLQAIRTRIEQGAKLDEIYLPRYAIHPERPQTDPAQLAERSFGVRLQTSSRGGRPTGRISEYGSAIVTAAIPLNVQEEYTSQREAMRWHQSLSKALITQDQIPEIHLRPAGLPATQVDGQRLIVTSTFELQFNWSPDTEI